MIEEAYIAQVSVLASVATHEPLANAVAVSSNTSVRLLSLSLLEHGRVCLKPTDDREFSLPDDRSQIR